MKYSSLLFLILLVISCSGSKKAIENASNSSRKMAIVANKKEDSIHISETKHTTEIPKEHQALENLKAVSEVEIHKDSIGIHKKWQDLLSLHVSENGLVDYKRFKTEQAKLKDYIALLGNTVPNDDWNKASILAYWINAYNAFTIDLILQNYPLKSIKEIKDPWQQRLWKLGEKWYNLDEIEHQILRKMDEPRIHFAIVCASFSCPKLQNKAFLPSTLEEQLTEATRQFLSDPERNIISANTLELSKIFQWFAKDFKQNGSQIDFLNQYSDIEISNDAKISFKKYNWDLNE